MKLPNLIPAALCAVLLSALSPNALRADDWNDRTVVTFSSAVNVPGKTLDAGTYVFKVLESAADRIVVQITNERESHVVATVIATPNFYGTPEARRDDPIVPTVEKTTFTFYEAPADQPRPIKTWFYPGQSFGMDFVYNKGER